MNPVSTAIRMLVAEGVQDMIARLHVSLSSRRFIARRPFLCCARDNFHAALVAASLQTDKWIAVFLEQP